MPVEKKNMYVGHRYVPKVMGEWEQTETYEGLCIVMYQGNSYTSKKRVPVGINISNEEYWVITGNYNAQIEQYRQDVKKISDDVTAKFTTIELLSGSEINPDSFTGTDTQKLQQSINLALVYEGKASIKLNRVFDVTGTTLKISKGDVRYPVYFIGGGLRKDDSGFLFDSDVTNSSDIYFNHVFFQSISGAGTIIFNAEKIIRLHTFMCQYKNVDCIARALTSHAQSIRSVNDTSTGGVGYAFDLQGDVYDCSFDNFTGEVRESVFRIGRAHAVRIKDGVLEGLSGTAIKIMEDCSNLTIENIYFEKNKVSHIDMSTMVNAKGLSIKKNQLLGEVDGFSDSLIKWGTLVTSVESEMNGCFKGRVHDASKTVLGANFIYSNNDYAPLENLNTARIRKDQIKQITTKAAKDQEPWKTPVLLNDWANLGVGFTTAGYYKDEFGMIHLKGLVKSGLVNTVIFKLPELYTPATAVIMASVSNNLPAAIKIESNGDIIGLNGDPTKWISLDGLHFRG